MIAPRLPSRSLRPPALPRRATLPGWWRRFSPGHLLWLVIWAPWWAGNDVAPPAHPRSRELEMTEQPAGSAGDWLLESLDDLKLRFGLSWAAALLIRGAWLGGVVGIGWIVFAMLTGAPSPTLMQLAVLAGIGGGLGLVLLAFHRPRYTTVAMLLERSFPLRSRVSTAIMALRYGSDAPGRLHAIQLADAANTLDRTRKLLRPMHWVPVREIFIAFIVALMLLLLLVARRPEGEVPPLAAGSFPGFVPVSERLAAQQQPVTEEVPDAATLQEVEDLSRTSNQARQDLDAIRDALDETVQTQPAAEAIASEDYPTANQRLTEASDAVTQLPDAARAALADQLEDAANRISEDNAALSDAASEAADDVRSGDNDGALDELGDAIERTGEDVIPQQSESGELAAQSGESQSGSSGSTQGGGAEQPEQAESGSGGDPGESGDPGAGMDASGGSGQPGESSQGGGEGGEGGSQSSGEGAPGSGDEAGSQQGEPQGSGSTSDGQPGEPSGDGSGSSEASGDQESGDQGAGSAGGSNDGEESGESSESDGGGATESGEDQDGDSSAQGEAAENPPAGGEGDGDAGAESPAGGTSIQLPGTSGERVSSGSDIGASSVGSGGGVGAASGNSTSGVSGSSGPDPNTVPPAWRDVVERYFQEGGAP